jgi:cytochrome c-type biogenesis protein CcmH/NrfF
MVKQEEDTEGYKVIGWIFLILAVILLLNAILLNPSKSQLGLVLFIFGDILLLLGATIAYLTGGKKNEKQEISVSDSNDCKINLSLNLPSFFY